MIVSWKSYQYHNSSFAETPKFSNEQSTLIYLSLCFSLWHFLLHLQVPPVMLCLPDLYRDWANCQISFTKIGTSIALTLSGAGGLSDCPIGLSSHVACVALVLHAALCRYSPQQLPQHQYRHTHTQTHSRWPVLAMTMTIISPFSLSCNRRRRRRCRTPTWRQRQSQRRHWRWRWRRSWRRCQHRPS